MLGKGRCSAEYLPFVRVGQAGLGRKQANEKRSLMTAGEPCLEFPTSARRPLHILEPFAPGKPLLKRLSTPGSLKEGHVPDRMGHLVNGVA